MRCKETSMYGRFIPTFTIKIQLNVGKYTIDGWYGKDFEPHSHSSQIITLRSMKAIWGGSLSETILNHYYLGDAKILKNQWIVMVKSGLPS